MKKKKNNIITHFLFAAFFAVSATGVIYAQNSAAKDKTAMDLADTVATAFFNGLGVLDQKNLLRGRLALSMQNWIAEPEFESKTFKSFAAMERWMKDEENQPGFPMRTSGERVSCRRGLCRLDLKDGQMMHNHVYLTRIWYGYDKGKIYVKRIRILYG